MARPREPVERISAVTLATPDMARSVGFYRALGFTLVSGGATAAFSTFRAGDGFLNVQLDDRRPREVPRDEPVWGRVIFWVDDVDAMYQRVVAAGFEPEAAPADASWGERYFHLRDPDGNELSFARPLEAVHAIPGPSAGP
jgi:catechol 2,3-dioxygenase-like lactoylglutathione lyase family enzyme